MARQALTKDLIDRVTPRDRPYKIHDLKLPGFYLRVQPSGIKSWNIRHPGSKYTDKSIGKFPVMSLAVARERARAELLAGPNPKTIKPITFKAFVTDHYEPWAKLERKAGAATVKNLRAQFSDTLDKKLLAEISNLHIERFKMRRLKDGIHPVTVNRDLDRIRAALAWAVERKLLAANPVTEVKRVKVEYEFRDRHLSEEEEGRLRDALPKAPGYLQALTLLAINLGCRRGELLELNWKDVNLKERRIKVAAANSKTGRYRYIPLNDEALAVLEGLGHRVGLVIPGASGRRMTNFKRSWASLLKAAKIEGFHFHDLRHTFASNLVRAGIDLFMVQQLLGHSEASMTARYAHHDDKQKAAAVAKLSVVR